MCTFVKIRVNTITLHSIHTVHIYNQSINILVKCLPMRIHGHYLSYKHAIYTTKNKVVLGKNPKG